MRKDVIDLSRAVPPVVPALEAALAKSIEARVYRPDAGGLLRTNRPRGTEEDRRTGAEWISQRLGFTPDIDRMIVTNGTLNVLFLLLNHLVGRSGTLLTEEMTYPNMQALSDVHNQSFGQNYGTLIEGLPMPLLSRAVFVVDKGGKITYAEYVTEVASEPNYDAAMAALKAAAG